MKNKKIIWGFVLVISIICFNMIWFNTTFTMSEGWNKFYIELINHGKLPYRDFYYFLLPLNLLIDRVLWGLSFNYFSVFRAFCLAERVVIVLLAYRLLIKRKRLFICSHCFYRCKSGLQKNDLIGDYNQIVEFFGCSFCISSNWPFRLFG